MLQTSYFQEIRDVDVMSLQYAMDALFRAIMDHNSLIRHPDFDESMTDLERTRLCVIVDQFNRVFRSFVDKWVSEKGLDKLCSRSRALVNRWHNSIFRSYLRRGCNYAEARQWTARDEMFMWGALVAVGRRARAVTSLSQRVVLAPNGSFGLAVDHYHKPLFLRRPCSVTEMGFFSSSFQAVLQELKVARRPRIEAGQYDAIRIFTIRPTEEDLRDGTLHDAASRPVDARGFSVSRSSISA